MPTQLYEQFRLPTPVPKLVFAFSFGVLLYSCGEDAPRIAKKTTQKLNDTIFTDIRNLNNVLIEFHKKYPNPTNKIVYEEVKTWYSNGNIKQYKFYINGRAEGVSTGYYENGQVEHSGLYNAGKTAGIWMLYDRNGGLNEKRFFKDGELQGLQYSYYPDGKVKRIVFADWGNIIFDRQLNSVGEITREKGKPIFVGLGLSTLTDLIK